MLTDTQAKLFEFMADELVAKLQDAEDLHTMISTLLSMSCKGHNTVFISNHRARNRQVLASLASAREAARYMAGRGPTDA